MTARYWWVNHKQASRQEIEGSYLWSPKKSKSGAKNFSYDNMTRAIPGEVVFSFADGKISAIGVVIERVRTAPAPLDSGPAADQWQTEGGWLLPVRFQAVSEPLLLKSHIAALRPLLPAKHAPIRANGDANPSVHLAEIPPNMAGKLEELLCGQVQEVEAEAALESNDQLTASAIEEEIWRRTNLNPREKRELISARIGQGIFRQNVEVIETSCRITGVLDRRHLRARHIKPWKESDDREKLDGFNGLLLSPHIDHLFDRGHISFTNDGRMLVSEHLNPTVIRAWGLDGIRPPMPFRPQHWVYLDFHRRHVFEKTVGGRRR